ncbi:hypothetical protein [Paenibacillus spongiae]|uniref:DUF1440 domain-containing protein n=1 Tax=Paenibacillus spongiae TaxID=2909671 RepID=A0ABY5S2U0_9BACL|nr:hypothetical protein [Paenibacillus spongiae]UVI27974.1 hypothetical protein L1F29_21270 [Paenibacillus spongiae]
MHRNNRQIAPLSLRIIVWGAAAGIFAGTVLGLFLKWVQNATGEQVYTLLLNIDFIPYMPMRLTESVEFLLHLVVSAALGIVYLSVAAYRGKYALWGVIIGVLASLAWIPLTLVSDRVPSISNGQAFSLWLLGHVIYGIALALMASLFKPLFRRRGES